MQTLILDIIQNENEITQITIIDAYTKATIFNKHFENTDELIFQKENLLETLKIADLIIGYDLIKNIRILKNKSINFEETYKLIDIMLPFSAMCKEPDSNNPGYKMQPLETCTKYYGYTMKNNNDALERCHAILYCFWKMREQQEKEIFLEK